MTISIIQAAIIGVFAYLGSLSVPWAIGLTGGWYTLSRPLVSGAIIGLVLGDVKTGIIVGVAVQTVYIALITPGGQMPQDLNAAAYIGVGLGVITVRNGASVEAAVSIATAVGAVGTIFHNFLSIVNSFWNHRAIKAINEGDTRALKLNQWVYPQIVQFGLRFIPTFLILISGQAVATTIIEMFPVTSYVMRVLTVLGGMLPAVGVAILLTQVVDKNIDIIRFLVGFTLVSALGINMISLAIFAAFIAYSYFLYTTPKGGASTVVEVTSDMEEEL